MRSDVPLLVSSAKLALRAVCLICSVVCAALPRSRFCLGPRFLSTARRYTVRLEADKATCPVLLSNGKCTETGDLPNGW